MTRIMHGLSYSVLVLWVSITLTFFLLRILPGDALQTQLIQSGASQIIIEQRRTEQGLNKPILTQYWDFLLHVLQGDFGFSLQDGRPVLEIISQQFYPTVQLGMFSITLATVIGLVLGITGGFDSIVSLGARIVIGLSISMPIYWTGTLIIYIFTVLLNYSSSEGIGEVILPGMVLSFHVAGAIALIVQANIHRTRNLEFVRVARAKGLGEKQVILHHILRVGLLPVVTVIALQSGFVFSGTVIIETLFVRPGIGTLLLNAIRNQDYPVVQGIVILSTVIYTFVNTLANVLYQVIDPRITA